MKKKVIIYTLLLFITSLRSVASPAELPVDTVINRVMSVAENYNNLVESFSAEVYSRTYMETVKKNFFGKYTHYIPHFVLYDPHNDAAVIETISALRFEFPNNYVQDIRHITGTLTGKKNIDLIPFGLLCINVYGETTNNESFFMPTRFSTSKYYRYELTRTFDENGKTYYSVNFDPIYQNSRLLKGTLIIEKGTWRIVFLRGEGVDIFSTISFEITMGDEWITNFLPVQVTIYQTVSILGNVIANRHLATIDYKDIRLRKTTAPSKSLNISDLYKVRLDSVSLSVDSVFWNERRPIPLQAIERDVLAQHQQQLKEKAALKAKEDSLGNPNIAQQMQRVVLTSNYKYRSSAIDYSGLLNPLMFGYTSREGITYGQRISCTFDFRHNRSVSIKASGGYMFRFNEFFGNLTTTWNYEPSHLGSTTVSVGKGNPIFSPLFVDQVKDSLSNRVIDFDDISEKYYRDYYLKMFNTIEITNGLLLQAGIEYNIRKSVDDVGKLNPDTTGSTPVEDLFGTRRSFAPFLRLSWTPRQYYRFDGRQKIYQRSPFPTFQVEFSRSFRHVLGSSTEYDRFEFDISQNIQLGLRHSLRYRVGVGKFINQKTEYFANFVYFSKTAVPDNWDDKLSGIFNLLSLDLYNAFDSYVQAHATFEAPFLLLKSVPFLSGFATTERVYISHLLTPQITSYSEIGYGIGNRFFNAGLFGSFHKTEFKRMGVRFTFGF